MHQEEKNQLGNMVSIIGVRIRSFTLPQDHHYIYKNIKEVNEKYVRG